MDVIPAIDLWQGQCVRLTQGDFARSEVFSTNPVQMAQAWVRHGATRLHVVDLAGAKTGTPQHLDVIRDIVRAVDIPVQVGGGIRQTETIAQLLALGVDRVIVGTVAVQQPEQVERWCAQFPGRIWVSLDARQGQVAVAGWQETTATDVQTLAQALAQRGVAGFIYTDIERDGTLAGPDIDGLRALLSAVSVPVLASGGVGSMTDLLSLLALEPLGLAGVIIGKALYTGDVDLKQALRAVGPGRWQDVPFDEGPIYA
ncbi:MAG: 1-(5-phosphoribosyl)-5-[(5-phosphoribosylamino)methylideneamino]imidazole-4-carboxamide isomerase [Gloeomargarita sp. SKYG116]|nr:1-(5-phosphoribosyl)-5-[(5-phosphoribosylamino)methylideneamino]imidazole-4-carboxamide isomerase [Gloeomargarita sp. SKYG116]MCS7292902.1 1-(5-phosphoribosyl)-5-[(5-phosphoribosylamino)methylideneamino]imidazole-4-carboxamide isomerase [Gloeomargarita sp. SKYB120]MDW8178465.1 1-(5-phosphoribosyl)-5-[(5-phosphoribosylamino)methylideneamino]imidazole-4-carboxamide isomerase [Gloeomargarita sp. SKYBB_i_bin120]MDW8400355.1 1-(5-phosphoribosyl)-5-[(5-phosphoribosylamino)methylideneamino]imidazole